MVLRTDPITAVVLRKGMFNFLKSTSTFFSCDIPNFIGNNSEDVEYIIPLSAGIRVNCFSIWRKCGLKTGSSNTHFSRVSTHEILTSPKGACAASHHDNGKFSVKTEWIRS